MSVVLSAVPSTTTDLTTSTFVSNLLLAGGVTLTSAQTAVLSALITAASKEIIRFCGRLFTSVNYVELLAPEGARQDRGEPASAKLTGFPVLDITRCATGRTTVLQIENQDANTNQDAWVKFVTVGDVEWPDLTYSALELGRLASGTLTADTVEWTTATPFTTIQSIASSINALGGGWNATVNASGSPNPALLPAAYMVGAREPKNAFSPGASLDVFAQSYTSYDIQRSTGIMRCYWSPGWGNGFGGGWGDAWGAFGDGFGSYGAGQLFWPQIWCSYTAGFATVPEPLQRVCAEVVKAAMERLKTDTSYQTISGGNEAEHWAKTVRASWQSLPDWCRETMGLYRDWKV